MTKQRAGEGLVNICMILDSHDLTIDARVSAEARQLAQDGHRVVVVCDHVPDRDNREILEGAEIVRLGRPRPMWLPIRRAIQLLSFIELRWLVALIRLHRQVGFDVVHVHDLPMSGTALLLGLWIGCPVVLDLHENYPVLVQGFWPSKLRLTQRFKKRVFYGLRRWARYESRCTRMASRIIVTTDEARDRIVRLGVAPERVTRVANLLTDEFIALPSQDPELESVYRDRFVISYLGSMSATIRIDTAIRAMTVILERVPNAHLLLVGEVQSIPHCRSLADRLEVSEHVTFVEWQPRARVPAYMSVSQIGLLPFDPNEQWHESVATKLYQYMYMGRPVLASECRAMARIISETGCGLVVDGLARDPVKLANAVIQLAGDPAARAAMGARGRATVLSRYRWVAEAARLSTLYSELESQPKGRSGRQ